jgi:hypothetical protein
MTDVKNSRLYKTLKRAVRKEDHAELLRMLEMLPESVREPSYGWDGLKAKRLANAFAWSESPQGYNYWMTLARRIRSAGHDK